MVSRERNLIPGLRHLGISIIENVDGTAASSPSQTQTPKSLSSAQESCHEISTPGAVQFQGEKTNSAGRIGQRRGQFALNRSAGGCSSASGRVRCWEVESMRESTP